MKITNFLKLHIKYLYIKPFLYATIIAVILILMTLFALFYPRFHIEKLESIIIILLIILSYILYTVNIYYHLFRIKFKLVDDVLNQVKTNTPDIVYLKNLNSEIFDCNDALLKFWNFNDKSKVIGSSALKLMSEGDIACDRAVILTGKTVKFKSQVKDANGLYHTFEVVKTPIFDENNNVIGTSSIARDITPQVMAEKSQRTFNEMLAHDIKTPIIAQINILEFLLEEKCGTLNDEQKELIKHTISSGKFAKEMVMAMLTTYRFYNEDYKFTPELVNMEDLVEECIEQLKIIGYNKSLKFLLEKQELILSEAFVDKLSIQRVILNLLFNAVSYSCENSTIKVEIKSDSSNFIFSALNKSFKTNMTKDDLFKMYNRYYSSKNKYKQVGSGIGLYMSKTIIENHDGISIYDVIKNDENFDYFKFGFSIPLKNNKLTDKIFKFKD